MRSASARRGLPGMSKFLEGNEHLIVREVAQLFCKSTTWVYRHSSPGSADCLPCVRMGRALLYDVNDLRVWIDSRKAAPGGKLLAGGGTARERSERMLSRRRCQNCLARMRGRKTMYWEGVYYEYVTGLNGETARERRFVFLGYSSELPNKRAAERKLGEMLTGINSLDYKPRSVVTLQEFLDSVYTETVLKHKKPSTRRDIQTGLRKHILPKFGSRQMTQISKLDLQRHFTGLIESRTLSWYTARKIGNYLSGVYSRAIKLECGVKSNPVSGIDLGAAPGHPDPGFLTDEGVAAVEEALPDQVSKTVWWLVAVSGVRTGEARALRWKAADKKHGKLWIDESRFEGQTLKPKSVRGKRGIDLSQHQLERLDGYRKLFPEATDDDFLFPSSQKWRRSPLCL